jgi:hypothetical protein
MGGGGGKAERVRLKRKINAQEIEDKEVELNEIRTKKRKYKI